MGRIFTSYPLLIALSLGLTSGCYDTSVGPEPPLNRIYFPVGLAVTPEQDQLLVANSDFDLQYDSGSLQVLDLKELRKISKETFSDESCGGLGLKSTAEKALSPGRCKPIDLEQSPSGKSLLVQSIGIGAFATDLLLKERWDTGDDPGTLEREFVGCTASAEQPGGDCAEGVCRPWLATQADAPEGYTGYCAVSQGYRVFVPVRGDATLHYFDSTDAGLECGQARNAGACSAAYRRGDEPESENTRGLRMPPEPFGIAASDDGEAILITHQSEGRASLFVNSPESGPRLEFVASGMPSGAVGVVSSPQPLWARLNGENPPGFLVSFRNSATVELLQYHSDLESGMPRPFLTRAGSVPLSTNSVGFESRGLGVDGSSRQACEAKCLSEAGGTDRAALLGQEACLTKCRDDVSVDVYVANRSPASLVRGRSREDGSELPIFFDAIPLSQGPSRVVSGEVLVRCSPTQAADDSCRRKEKRLFVICFDARRVYVVKPSSGAVESVFQTGRGPHALVTDVKNTAGEAYAFGYLAHFTDSYLGVIDLDQGSPTYGEVLANVGEPTAPRASK